MTTPPPEGGGLRSRSHKKNISAGKPSRALPLYGEENATQRGSNSTAVAGSVAAALKFLAKHGGSSDGGNHPSAQATNRGIGWTQICDFLDGIPGVNINTVKEQLANLKASGDHAVTFQESGKETAEDWWPELDT